MREMILMGRGCGTISGLMVFSCKFNTPLGQPDERARHRAELISYFRGSTRTSSTKRRSGVCTQSALRILDSKNPAMQAMIEGRRS